MNPVDIPIQTPTPTPGPALMYIAIAAFVILIPVIWAITTHNRIIHLANLIRESWANVDVALKRRHDLIPNLVETVKGYSNHEQAVFEDVARAREQAINAMEDVAKLRDLENELSRGIVKIMARAEAYPELKASVHFLELQKELANTEDRIAAARRFYNANVREFNTVIAQFPSSLLAGGREPKDHFEIDDVAVRETPSVAI